MNIFCANFSFAGELEKQGHNVLAPDFQAGVVHLPAFLKLRSFTPDLVIQEEKLSDRVFFGGLEEMKCPTAFISVDTHLNLFWQQYYVRLFDLVFSAHISFFDALPLNDEPGKKPLQVKRLGHRGYDRPWMGFNERGFDLSFCGILGKHRTVRRALVELLGGRFGLRRPVGRISFGEMMDLFADSRIIPNESISGEVNFRIFEAASCGCLPLSGNIGDDQDAHFTPGKEVIVYDHALDLLEKTAFYLKKRGEAEKIGRAAWERVRRCHLPRHRTQDVLDCALNPGSRAGRIESAKLFCLTLAALARHGSHPLPAPELLRNLRVLPEDGEIAAAILSVIAECGMPESPLFVGSDTGALDELRREGLELCLRLLGEKLYASSTSCNLSGSVFCLLLGDLDRARLFWLRQKQEQARKSGRPGDALSLSGRIPKSPYEFYLLWADLLIAEKRLTSSGFRFPGLPGFMPDCAMHCLFLAREEKGGEHREISQRMHQVCRLVPGYAYMDLGFLGYLSIDNPDNWHWRLRYGQAALKCMFPERGIEEIRQARRRAEELNEEAAFKRLLAEQPGWEYTLHQIYSR